MDGRRSVRDIYSRAIAHIDVGTFQIDSRLASGDTDLLVKLIAHSVISIIVDIVAIVGGNFRDRLAHRQVYGVHVAACQRGGEVLIYRSGLAVYPDKVGRGYIARHYVGLPALGVAVSLFLHL